MYKKVIVASLLLATGCASNSGNQAASSEPARAGKPAPQTPFSDGFFDSNMGASGDQWKEDPFAMPPGNAQSDSFAKAPVPPSSNPNAFQVFDGAPQKPPIDDLTQGNATLNADIRNANPVMRSDPLYADPMMGSNQLGVDDPLFPPTTEAMMGGPFIVARSQPFKDLLKNYVEPQGFRLIWDTPFNVTFENDVVYNGEDLMTVLKAVARDLNAMAVDIHMNVYLKNKVILVYSVRK